MPTYHTAKDDQNETRVAEIMANHWGCDSFQKLDEFHDLDYAFFNSKGCAVAEIKCRKNKINQYPDIFVSANKIIAGQQHIKIGVAAFFVAQFTDCKAAFISMAQKPDYFSWGGRNTRQKREVLAHFKISRLKVVE
jgi:hypothetical protein